MSSVNNEGSAEVKKHKISYICLTSFLVALLFLINMDKPLMLGLFLPLVVVVGYWRYKIAFWWMVAMCGFPCECPKTFFTHPGRYIWTWRISSFTTVMFACLVYPFDVFFTAVFLFFNLFCLAVVYLISAILGAATAITKAIEKNMEIERCSYDEADRIVKDCYKVAKLEVSLIASQIKGR